MKSYFFFIEGNDDKMFFEKIVKGYLLKSGFKGRLRIHKYAELKNEKISGIIKNFKNDFVYFIADINSEVCVTSKKQKIKSSIPLLEFDQMVIVKAKIESWYLSGMPESFCQEHKNFLDNDINFNTIGKYKFASFKPKNFDLLDFKLEILKNFDLSTARSRNESLDYFIRKITP